MGHVCPAGHERFNMMVSVKIDIEATVISMYKYFSLQLNGVHSSLGVPR